MSEIGDVVKTEGDVCGESKVRDAEDDNSNVKTVIMNHGTLVGETTTSEHTDAEELRPQKPRNITAVSLLNEMCMKFKISMPSYQLEEESGEASCKTFLMSVAIPDMGLKAMGEAKTKMGAKHAAVKCAFQTISDAAEKGQNLEQVSCDILLVCQKMLSECSLETPEKEQLPQEICLAAGKLKEWEMETDQPFSEFETVEVSGPSHDREFVVVCKKDGHVTRGVGKSKKIAKNVAAYHMLKILGIDSDSPFTS